MTSNCRIVTHRNEPRANYSSCASERHYQQHATPAIATLAASPNPVAPGSTLTLTASGVTDDGTVTSVSFYRETNNVAGLQVGFQGDTLVGTDTTPGPGGEDRKSTRLNSSH